MATFPKVAICCVSEKYTGQYADPLTGFDYYNARYYDPVCGTFLSADPVEGNMQGMNPYAYVDGNPETNTDPTGNMYAPPPGGGGGGSGGGGGGGGGGGTSPPSCQGLCWFQQQWNNFNNNVMHPAEHLVQQAQQVIIQDVITHVPLIVPIVIGVAIAGAIGSGAYAIWQFTHTNPNWSNVGAGENVTHPRWLWNKEPVPGTVPSTGHVLDKHVNISNSRLINRAKTSQNHEATKFYNQDLAQYAVDYALSHMTMAQKLQLLWMRGSPFGRFATLTLTGTSDVALGYGFRYNTATKTLTKFTDLTTYKVVIGIDFKTGQPFIISAYPTLPT